MTEWQVERFVSAEAVSDAVVDILALAEEENERVLRDKVGPDASIRHRRNKIEVVPAEAFIRNDPFPRAGDWRVCSAAGEP